MASASSTLVALGRRPDTIRSPRVAILMILIVSAIVLGGGGTPNVSTEFLLLLLTAAMLPVVALLVPMCPTIAADKIGWAALLALPLVPLAQLIPLPPALWQSLAGRDETVQVLDAIGERGRWMSLSLYPANTLAVALSLAPALLVAVVTAALPPARRLAGLWAILAASAASVLLGIIQFVAGPERTISLYGYVHQGFAIGFFASRNAQGDLIAIALSALTVLAYREPRLLQNWSGRAATATLAILLLLGGVASGSRAGIALLLVPLALATWLFRARLVGLRAWVTVALALTIVAGVAASGTALSRVSARFTPDQNRQRIREDSVDVAARYAPVGGGMGTFAPLQQESERLENIGPTLANRAHNDYLELWIEGGVPAIALLLGLVSLVIRRVQRACRSSDRDARALALFAGATFVIVALHSALDYPLRTFTHLMLAAYAYAGLLAFSGAAADTAYFDRSGSNS